MFGEPSKSTPGSTANGQGVAEGHESSAMRTDLMSPSSDFGDFMSAARPSDTLTSGDSDLFGILKKKDSSKQPSKDKNKSFLPSQLFDLDQKISSSLTFY